jgi:Mg-chelatase subunit ChlD
MNAKLLAIGLLAATAATVAIYPSLRGHATGVPRDAAVQAPAGKSRVEVVFVLDTTGSMGGLIAAAKEKIWSIASTLAQAEQAPEIAMGLVAYRDRGDAYVTRIVDLSTDLDSMYATLMDFAADGGGDGPESVNEALHDAVHGMSWTRRQDTYRVLFLVGDAPPHMDYQDDAKYPQIVAAAREKGIVVNTIQCGAMPETAAHWQRIAALGQGRYFTVEQSGGAVAVATPFDGEIATLAAELDGTRLYYGSAEERAAMVPKAAAAARVHAEASVAAQARRGAFNATASGAANFLGERELVSDVAGGRVDLASLPTEELPPPLAAAPREERAALVRDMARRRAQLTERIAELARERDDYIAAKVAAEGGAEASLDRQIYDAVREQGAAAGLRYEAGPKY